MLWFTSDEPFSHTNRSFFSSQYHYMALRHNYPLQDRIASRHLAHLRDETFIIASKCRYLSLLCVLNELFLLKHAQVVMAVIVLLVGVVVVLVLRIVAIVQQLPEIPHINAHSFLPLLQQSRSQLLIKLGMVQHQFVLFVLLFL
jgi:hypothetical protein